TLGALNTAIKGRAIIDTDNLGSGNSGDSGRTGDTHADGTADSFANSGAASESTSTSGDTGSAANALILKAGIGDGGNGGDRASAHSGRAGDARSRFRVGGHTTGGTGPVTGGDSIANTSADGGEGGSVNASQTPSALSGNSGAS